MTDFRQADGLPAPSAWMTDKLAHALASDICLVAMRQEHETGKSNLAVMYSFAQAPGPIEDYTCDKCREFHPSGLNVAVCAIGRDVEHGLATVTTPVEMMEWATVIVSIGLCHKCYEAEGYPHNPLADLDPGFVQQAVRLVELPPLDVLS